MLTSISQTYAAELGVLAWQLEAAIRLIPDVGRVHVHRWADGSSHFHVWFVARPARQVEFFGWGNICCGRLDSLGQASSTGSP